MGEFNEYKDTKAWILLSRLWFMARFPQPASQFLGECAVLLVISPSCTFNKAADSPAVCLVKGNAQLIQANFFVHRVMPGASEWQQHQRWSSG